MTRPDQFADLDERGHLGGEPTPAPEPTTEDTDAGGHVPKARFDEVLEDRKRLESMVNEFALAAMRGGPTPANQPPENQPAPAPSVDMSALDGLDEDAAKAISALIEQKNQQFAQGFTAEFQQAFGPVLEQASRIAQQKEVEETIPGFKGIQGEVAQRYQALPSDRREEYNSRVGVEALALKVEKERLEAQLAALQGGASPMARRAAMTPANRGGIATPMQPSEPEVDVWGMDDEAFENYKAQNGLK